MSTSTSPTSTDITVLILAEHDEFRARFTDLMDLRDFGPTSECETRWDIVSDLLEVHAKAEEEIFYPVLLKRGSDKASDETVDAVGDHNQIRDAIALAGQSEVGSDWWWAAVQSCRDANDEHLAEEERDVLPDFREHTSEQLRSELGETWLKFHADHQAAQGISTADVNPEGYVQANS
jgi:hypothetical protein